MIDKKLDTNQDKVPMNLDEAVAMLKAKIPSDFVEFVKRTNSSAVHFGLGMQIRNDWSLWDIENPLVKWFEKEYNITHADDISGIILDCLWQDIKGLPRRDRIQAENTNKYWEALKKAEEEGTNISLHIDEDGNVEILPSKSV
jgi:hypothetical protein